MANRAQGILGASRSSILTIDELVAPKRMPPPPGPDTRSLSIVIPAFNEEHRIPETLLNISAFVLKHRYDAEILVVSDGSTDSTAMVVARLADSIPILKVCSYSQNRGKGFATQFGVLQATRAAILTMDADLSTPICELDKLWPWYDDGYQVVIGSRRQSGAQIEVQQPLHRRWMGEVFRRLVGLLAVRGFSDTQCGFKLFRTDIAKNVFQDLRTRGFAFDVEILLRSRRLHYRIAEVGVRWMDSRQSRVNPIRDSWRMMLEVLRLRNLL